jgi:hypothetical protein
MDTISILLLLVEGARNTQTTECQWKACCGSDQACAVRLLQES